MKKIALILMIVFLAGLGLVYLGLETMILKRLNEALSQSFTTKASLQKVDLQWSNSSFSATDLVIENPSGFERREFLKLGKIMVRLQPSSLLEGTIIIEELNISGLALLIAQDEKGLNTQILAPQTEAKKSTTSAKRELLIRSMKVDGLKLFAMGMEREKEVEIPGFRLQNIRIGTSPLPPIIHAIRQIMEQILNEAMKQYKSTYKQQIINRIETKVMDKLENNLRKLGIQDEYLQDAADSLKQKLKKFF